MENEIHLKLETEHYYGHNHAYLEMSFNGQFCGVDIAENKDWFKQGDKTYQIWGIAVMLNSSGTGMSHVKKIRAEKLFLYTEFGNFLVRNVKPEDKMVYGVNNFRGVYLEKLD